MSADPSSITIPPAYLCPISLSLMMDPVLDSQGTTFDRSSIIDWLSRGNDTSPVTRMPLSTKDLIPNRALKEAIEQFLKENPSLSVSSLASSPPPLVQSEGKKVEESAPLISSSHDEKSSSLLGSLSLSPSFPSISTPTIGLRIIPPSLTIRRPTDIVCLVDVSGSMGCNVTLKGNNNGNGSANETYNLTQLDLVIHSIKTVIKGLSPHDRISIITFSDDAKEILPFIHLDSETNIKRATTVAESMKVEGSTNIWSGLAKALRCIHEDYHNNHLNSAEYLFRNTALFVLTDGMSNIDPPRGLVPTLEKYLDESSHKIAKKGFSIHTFGFGCALSSDSLEQISHLGNGGFSFLPDGGFVGTVFCNTLASVCGAVGNRGKVTVTIKNNTKGRKNIYFDGEEVGKVYKGIVLNKRNHDGINKNIISENRWKEMRDITEFSFSLDALCIGQCKDVTFLLHVEGKDKEGNFEGEGKVGLQDGDIDIDCVIEFDNNVQNERSSLSLSYPHVNSPSTAPNAVPLDNDFFINTHSRIEMVKSIRQSIEIMEGKTPRDAAIPQVNTDIDNLISTIQSHKSLLSPSSPSIYLTDLLKDIDGQYREAITGNGYYDKWGKHYLRSLSIAHFHQQCNNFKDPGVQHYGGQLFQSMRDGLDEIFITMPPPKPAASYFEGAGIYGGKQSYGYGGGMSTPAAPTSMLRFHDAGAGCFGGSTMVKMEDGEWRKIGEMRVGERVESVNNENGKSCISRIKYMVKMALSPLSTTLVTLPQLSSSLSSSPPTLTPYHPIKHHGMWTFPIDISNALLHINTLQEHFVYNIVLEENHTVVIKGKGEEGQGEGYVACTLGHGFRDNDVIRHEYFGTYKVIDDLEKVGGKYQREGERGYFEIPMGAKWVRGESGRVEQLVIED